MFNIFLWEHLESRKSHKLLVINKTVTTISQIMANLYLVGMFLLKPAIKFFFKILFIFRERGREREKGRQTLMWKRENVDQLLLAHPQIGDLACNWESNWGPFSFTSRAAVEFKNVFSASILSFSLILNLLREA